MKLVVILCFGLITLINLLIGNFQQLKNRSTFPNECADSLPTVLLPTQDDRVAGNLRKEAMIRFDNLKLPNNVKDWELFRVNLRNEIIRRANVEVIHDLPLSIKETQSIKLLKYEVKNISFQTRPGIYATANLYIPKGKGPFPGVIVTCGHSANGKLYENYQAVGHTLALNDYVALVIDPWGAGERTTIQGEFEYHGANLGASLMNIGESLMGMQISDNMRGVDLLCSLPYVDAQNIGATGASGGGNQTMWLAAIDNRVKAAVPVVSVGSFQSYVMRSNCVCELLIDGLTFTEEAGVLSLARAIMPCNHKRDSNPTFSPEEMLRTYNIAKPIFKMLGSENNIHYQLFDLEHGYMEEDRGAMLGWFDLHLKGIGTGAPKNEISCNLLQGPILMTFPSKQRDANVLSTEEFCIKRGNELRGIFLNTGYFDLDQKKKDLKNILRINGNLTLKEVHHYSPEGGWDRLVLETYDHQMIPLLHIAPRNKSLGYVILCDPKGKDNISTSIINRLKRKGSGIVIIDLLGTGELTSDSSLSFDKLAQLHTLSRAELWLGKTTLGEWVKELNLVVQFLNSTYKVKNISIDGSKEAGLAGMFLSALEGNIDNLILREAPVSYLFDKREGIDFFSMAIHLPGFLKWGDISLVSALSGKNIQFISPVTMSGNPISECKLPTVKVEFERIRNLTRQPGKSIFK